MVDTEDLVKGDAIRIDVRAGKTVMNAEKFERATFVSIGAKGVTFSYVNRAGETRRITRSLSRVEAIEKLTT